MLILKLSVIITDNAVPVKVSTPLVSGSGVVRTPYLLNARRRADI
jgi:hypothetical protein